MNLIDAVKEFISSLFADMASHHQWRTEKANEFMLDLIKMQKELLIETRDYNRELIDTITDLINAKK